VPPTETGWAVKSCRRSGESPAPVFGDLRFMKEGRSLQVLYLEFSSASVYRGNTVTAVELLSVLYELFV